MAVLAAGCESTRTPQGAARSTPPVPDDPDIGLAAQAMSSIGRLQEAVTRMRATFPRLHGPLTGFIALHQAHVDALAGAVPKGARVEAPEGPGPYTVPARRAEAMRWLVARERGLANGLADDAFHAQSGAFARLLASMSAAVDQRLAEWPS